MAATKRKRSDVDAVAFAQLEKALAAAGARSPVPLAERVLANVRANESEKAASKPKG